jgi:fumarate reductase subunit D
MFQFFKRLFITMSALIFFVAPLPSFAADTSTTASTPPSQLVEVTLINPLNTTDPRAIIANIIQAILSIIGSLALLMFVYGGFLWITSFGESKRIERGKNIVVWAVAGLALIASAYVVVNAVMLGLTTGSAVQL